MSLLALIALLFISGGGGLPVIESAPFEAPLQKKVVDFGLSAGNPPGSLHFRVKLHCYFYPGLMVKVYDDEGQKGARWLSILTFDKGAVPECTRSHIQGEHLIEDWGGYYMGAWGNLVFFSADDGSNGGMQFAIYDARTGSKIFEDNHFDPRIRTEAVADSPFNGMRISRAADGRIFLRYLRVVEADCDLHTEQSSCWKRITKKLHLTAMKMPVCEGYTNISSRYTSAVAYPVEVFLAPKPTIKTIAGPVRCWPVD